MLDLAIIPARGKSIGLPGKNIIDLGGKPLITWTIDAARSSQMFEKIVVSTDDEEIADVARLAGADVPFLRPRELATSTSSSVEVVNHVLDQIDIKKTFALLQPTSPLRTAHHICQAAQMMKEKQAPSLVSVTGLKPLNWAFHIDPTGHLTPVFSDISTVKRRQDATPTVVANGAIYIQTVPYFQKHQAFLTADTIGYRMGQIESIDIDELEDLKIARALFASGLHVKSP